MMPGVLMSCKQARCVLTLFEDYRMVEIHGRIDGKNTAHEGDTGGDNVTFLWVLHAYALVAVLTNKHEPCLLIDTHLLLFHRAQTNTNKHMNRQQPKRTHEQKRRYVLHTTA
jgi:hypothetical protein